MVLTFLGFAACSKSSKDGEKSDPGISSNKDISDSSGISSSGTSGKGIMLKVTGIPSEYNDGFLDFLLFDKDQYASDGYPAAGALGEIHNGSVELNLHDINDRSKKWTKPGDYYIHFEFPGVYEDGVYYRYTNGKTLKELGFDNLSSAKGLDTKYPTYSLKNTGNTINFAKQILRLDSNSTIGEPGIKITIVGIDNNYYPGTMFAISLYDNLDNFYNNRNPVAAGRLISKENLNVYLYELKGLYPDETKPWTKPGMYYLGIDLGGLHEQYYYTAGKTPNELGINSAGLVPKSQYEKLPKYKLELTGNTIDFNHIIARQGDRGVN